MNGKGKGIDIGIGNYALPRLALVVRIIGHGKQQAKIKNSHGGNDSDRQHGIPVFDKWLNRLIIALPGAVSTILT
ncbi:hypothetical protein JCM15764A_25660 [Geotalea toluenoxydans]